MPQPVRRDRRIDPGALGRNLDHPVHCARVEGRFPFAAREHGSIGGGLAARREQRSAHDGGQQHVAQAIALAPDAQLHLAIAADDDVGPAEGDELGHAKPAGIADLSMSRSRFVGAARIRSATSVSEAMRLARSTAPPLVRMVTPALKGV
jgi:hypothetical protein